MADTVRYFMEGMVPELDDLEEHGLFSRQELRAVVRKREAFEYALKRKLPAKADFLRYVEHERALGELLQLRKARLGIREDTRGEASITRRCHTIFERATRRFRGDLRLWLAWAEFCKASGSSRQMSKVLTQALQLHPREPGLWAYAAAWEFDANANATLARSLMQQGLRACKGSRQLWLDYLRLELTYAQKLAKRREVLGIAPGAGTGGEAAAAAEPAAAAAGEPGAEDAMAAVVNGAVASVVARQAAAQFPADVAFRRQLLAALDGYSFGGVATIAADILAGVEADFGGSEDAWDLRARRASGSAAGSSGQDACEAAEAVFERALAALPTARMHELYGAYLQEQVGSDGEAEAPQPLKGRRRKAARRALELYARAAQAGALSEAAALAWPPLALRCGKASQALQAAALGTAAHPASVPLWLQRIALAAQAAAGGGEAGQAAVAALVAEAAGAVPQERAGEVWLAGLRALGRAGGPPAAALEGLERAMAGRRKAAMDDPLGAAAAEAVRQVWAQQGPAAARGCYRRLLRLPPPGAALVHTVLDLELAESQQALPRGQLQAIFEAGVSAYGSADTRLWLRFARWAQSAGGGSGSIYWRATKELADPDAFVRQMAEPEAAAEQAGAESEGDSESGSEAGEQ